MGVYIKGVLTRTLVVHCGYHKFRAFLQTVQKVVNETGHFLCIVRGEGVFVSLDRYHGEALPISSPMITWAVCNEYNYQIITGAVHITLIISITAIM